MKKLGPWSRALRQHSTLSMDKLLMEYALQGISNQLFVTRYMLYLPDRAQLQHELDKLLSENERKE